MAEIAAGLPSPFAASASQRLMMRCGRQADPAAGIAWPASRFNLRRPTPFNRFARELIGSAFESS